MKASLLIPLLIVVVFTSCSQTKESVSSKNIEQQSQRLIQAIKLNKDEILVLEIHYPDVLQKIYIQEELKVKDILILHEVGVKEHILIHLIKYTSSNFVLTADEVVTMQLEGVPYSVIQFMIAS